MLSAQCVFHVFDCALSVHYADVIMTTMASQITSLTDVYSTVYSDADQRKHQSSASLAFVWGIHQDWWIPRTKCQLRGKCFHLMTSSWYHMSSHFHGTCHSAQIRLLPSPYLGAVKLSVGHGHNRCTLQWRHNERDGVSTYCVSIVYSVVVSGADKKTSKLSVTGLCVENSPVAAEFPAQKTSNA